jgi:hypothetical protein
MALIKLINFMKNSQLKLVNLGRKRKAHWIEWFIALQNGTGKRQTQKG